MMIITSEVPDEVKNEEGIEIRNNLYGEQFIADVRPKDSAGRSAQKSGKALESIVEHNVKKLGIEYIPRPPFKCHFGLDRKGDFGLILPDREIHIECKQLGNVESHFDKLSHCFMNLISGCYGKNFWLVYDFDGTSNLRPNGIKKISCLEKRSEEIKSQVALQGITFELILIDDFCKMLEQI